MFEKCLNSANEGISIDENSAENIYYMGTQYQITFADLSETKGFHILDTNTREIEFIENPYNSLGFAYKFQNAYSNYCIHLLYNKLKICT